MRNKKQKLWALALTLPLALSAVLGFSLLKPQAAKAETLTPLLRYDFSAENVDGNTVKNQGSKQNSNAVIVNGENGVAVKNGKLKFTQTALNTANGYLRLPDDMFSGLSSFTFRMDIDNSWVNCCGGGPASMLMFLPADPVATKPSGSYFEVSWANDGIDHNRMVLSPWDNSWSTRATDFWDYSWQATKGTKTSRQELSDVTLSVVWDGTVVTVYANTSVWLMGSLPASAVQNFVFNKIGGYLYSWGRSATYGTFDNVELYDAAMTVDEIAKLNESVSVDDKALLSYDFSSDSVSGNTVLNKGTKQNSDASIVNGENGVNVYSGKLKFSQTSDVSADNGFFKLPDDMFNGLEEFTFRMDVDFAWVNKAGLINFLNGDPVTATLTDGDFVSASWAWASASDDYFYIVAAPWDNYYIQRQSASIANYEEKINGAHYINKKVSVTIVWDGADLTYYLGSKTAAKATISAEKVANLTYNRIGGYRFNWGRSGVNGTFDNIELYGRAFSFKEIKAKNAEIKDDTELVLSYDFENENVDGNVVKNLGVKKNADASLVGSRGGKIQDGKLIFARTADYKYGNEDAENSYLSLPDDMFNGLDEFTLSIDVDYADVYAYSAEGVNYATRSLWHFTKDDPITTAANNYRLEFEWYASNASGNWQFYIYADDPKAWNSAWAQSFANAEAAEKRVSDGGGVRYDDFTDKQFTLSIVYKDNAYKVYWDDFEVYKSGDGTSITPADFANFVVNRFGGMYYGRNAAGGEFDNIKMWNKALSVETLKGNATRTQTQVIITGANQSVTGYSDNGTYVLPETAEVGENQRLIGYIYKNALYAPGQSIAVSGRTVRVKAVVMNFEMKAGASLRLTTLSDSGLRFRTYYAFDYFKLVQRLSDDTDLARVKSLVNDNITFGTLVTFADAIEALGEVSFENESFNVEGETRYIDIKTNPNTVYYDEEAGLNAYNSAIINLNSYSLEYGARSYVTVTYGDESARNYYTVYSRENNARSAKTVAESVIEKQPELYEQFKTIIDAYASGVKGE